MHQEQEQAPPAEPVAGTPPMAAPAAAVPARLAQLAEYLDKTRKARIAANTAVGAAQGAMNAPEGSRLEGAARGGATGGALSAGFEGLSSLLGKISNAARLKAVGAKEPVVPIGEGAKLNPETGSTEFTKKVPLGEKLQSLGITGLTKEQMGSQVARASASQEAQLQNLAKAGSGTTSAEDLVQMLKDAQKDTMDPVTGTITNPGKHRALQDKINEVLSSKGFSDQGLIQLKRSGQGGGFTSRGAERAGEDPEVNRQVGEWARQKLITKSPEMADVLQNERALVLANKALSSQSQSSLAPSMTDILLGGVGGLASGNPVTAGAITAGSRLARTTPVQSLFANVASPASKAAQAVSESGAIPVAQQLSEKKKKEEKK